MTAEQLREMFLMQERANTKDASSKGASEVQGRLKRATKVGNVNPIK